MQLIDGLPEIFTDVLGESVIYTPVATGTPSSIDAIWIEQHVSGSFDAADVDSLVCELHVSRSVVASPSEGDLVQRVLTGKIMKVVTPIRPDDQGMIACALQKST